MVSRRVLCLFMSTVVACSEGVGAPVPPPTTPPIPAGQARGACRPDGSCDPGLVCFAGTCVIPAADAGASAPPDAGPPADASMTPSDSGPPADAACISSPETCNGVDDDCDGDVDEADSRGCSVWYRDDDGDGVGADDSVCTCAPAPQHRAPVGGDCNDRHPGVSPARAGDQCNIGPARDDDCDGRLDEDASERCPGRAANAPLDPLWFPLDDAGRAGETPGTGVAARFSALIGTAVYASGSGRVVHVATGCVDPGPCAGDVCTDPARCACGGGLGAQVVIEHYDRRLTRYAHLESVEVVVGDIVCAGHRIGTVGRSGDACPAADGLLRFELWRPASNTDDALDPVDPLPGGGVCTATTSLFTDCRRYRGGRAFADDCAAIDALGATGVMAGDCSAHRRDPSTCTMTRAGAASALGRLVDASASASYNSCELQCGDLAPGDPAYAAFELMTRLDRGDGITAFAAEATCRPDALLSRAQFLRPLMESVGIPFRATGGAVPDLSEVEPALQPYVRGAVQAGLISATEPVGAQYFADAGWIARVTSAATTVVSRVTVSEADVRRCAIGCRPDHQACVGPEVHDVDSCGNLGAPVETCAPGEACVVTGTAAGCSTCPISRQGCANGDVYELDACGGRHAQLRDCTAVELCTETGTTATCVTACVPNDHQGCAGNDAYAYDSCGGIGALIDDCGMHEQCVLNAGVAQCVTRPCASNNGLYCGDPAYSQASGTLYDCRNGVWNAVWTCPVACSVQPPGTHDRCAANACPNGPGAYCGDDGMTLMRCTNLSPPTIQFSARCANACERAPAGSDDFCR